MANYTDDDDYDVFIYDPLSDNETLGKDGAEQCPPYDPAVLSAQLLPQLYTAVSLLGLLDNILMVFILVKCHRLRHVEHIYFLNLAVSNLCFLLTLPIQAHAASHGGTLDHPMCTVLVALTFVGLHSEALFNALLTLQSYLVCFQLVFAVMVVFLLMWGPYHVALFLSTFKDSFSLRDCGSRYHLDRSIQATGIIASTHCCVNPLLYVLLDKAFQRCLCPCCCPLPPTEDPAQDTPWEECDYSTQL